MQIRESHCMGGGSVEVGWRPLRSPFQFAGVILWAGVVWTWGGDPCGLDTGRFLARNGSQRLSF